MYSVIKISLIFSFLGVFGYLCYHLYHLNKQFNKEAKKGDEE